MRTWLVTGAAGFLGRHVLDRLASELPGERVVGLSRRLAGEANGAEWVEGSLDSKASIARALADVRPDVVVHLAGAVPPVGPAACFAANVGGTSNLIAGLRGLARPVRLVATGSAAELGPVPGEELPADEETPCRPVGAYGLSKWSATRLVMDAGGTVARVFNPIGPGMPASQALGRFAAILAGAEAEPVRLRVGQLDARRDFVDVRDVAAALVGLALYGRPARLYHVGTGVSLSVAEGLSLLIRLSGRAVVVERVESASGGVADSRASIDRIGSEIGWEPTVSFARSLADHWKGLVGAPRLALLDRAPLV